MPPLVNLTRQDFETSIQAFERKARKLAPNQEWQLKQDVTVSNSFVLDLELIRHSYSLLSFIAIPQIFNDTPEIDHDISDGATVELPDITTLQIEYHVVYSSSYQVPVLYFNAYYSNGSVLTRDELDQFVINPNYREPLKSSTLLQQGSVSQQEHPVLGLPFYYIHPCDTASLMTQVNISDINCYITSWLSFFGPLVGLYLPSKLGTEMS
ncbi:hypothetical protein NQZ79_g8770 [Umbelopsis isabellina]|nr:hypothetical protein NQZ79_g8770 [Umbelopsis isabellina]